MLTICIILIVLLALDLLFTLALRCRKGHQKWEILKKYRYAHRGYHDKPVIPENSLPAFRRAIERGFGAELDVHLLKDGTLAVFHDSDLRRCANVEGEIEDLTLDELKQLRLEGTDEQIPTFDEALALFEHATPLIIELKTARGNHKALAKADLLIIDTAGRLHNKKNLMEELSKMRRIIDREYSEATVRCMLIMDATTGQNGLNQAKMFKEAVEINGIILTKLDGTAKGGVAIAIRRELNVPVWYIGVGEGIDDLQAFEAKAFVNALFGDNEPDK